MKSINKKSTSHGKDLDDKVIISSEYYEDERPSFICSLCNRTLIRLTDNSQQNTTFWCRDCSVEFDPELENLRKESKISVPDRNIEPAVTTTPGIDYNAIKIRKELELKGGFAALAKKVIKITHYEERVG